MLCNTVFDYRVLFQLKVNVWILNFSKMREERNIKKNAQKIQTTTLNSKQITVTNVNVSDWYSTWIFLYLKLFKENKDKKCIYKTIKNDWNCIFLFIIFFFNSPPFFSAMIPSIDWIIFITVCESTWILSVETYNFCFLCLLFLFTRKWC